MRVVSRLHAALALLGLLCCAISGAQEALLRVTPQQWELGTISSSPPATTEITLSYSGDDTTEVSFIPTCDCLSASPAQLVLRGGETATVLLRFDPLEYTGAVELDFLVRTSIQGLEKAIYTVRATVQGGEGAAAGQQSSQAGRPGSLTLVYYFSPGCSACTRFLNREVPRLERELGLSIEVERRHISEPAVMEEYWALLERLGEDERAYPALLVGDRLLQGEAEISQGVESAITEALAGSTGGLGGELRGTAPAPMRPLALIPVLAAGLLDGINPCAFTTLIFLISALAVAGRGRREVLTIGAFFALSVFATYYVIGLGAFSALRAASVFPAIATGLKWLLFAVLLSFAALSVYDYAMIRRGATSRVLLQLPTAFKKRIHTSIKARSRSAALVASAVVMGFLVSVFELACTGQVYFPTIAYMVRSHASGYAYLLLYNVGFILPLLAVFVLSFFGLNSRRLAEFMQSSMGKVKLGLAVLFVGLAVLTLLT